MTQGDPVQNFLQSYNAPIEDAGFTALVMERADALVKKQARIRRWGLNAAFFIGGAVAAVQVPKLGALLSKLNESYNLAEVLPLDMRLPLDMSGSEAMLSVATTIPSYGLIIGALILGLVFLACVSDTLQL